MKSFLYICTPYLLSHISRRRQSHWSDRHLSRRSRREKKPFLLNSLRKNGSPDEIWTNWIVSSVKNWKIDFCTKNSIILAGMTIPMSIVKFIRIRNFNLIKRNCIIAILHTFIFIFITFYCRCESIEFAFNISHTFAGTTISWEQ